MADLFNIQWNKPSLGRGVPKISFARKLNDWGWVIGSGLYLDDIENNNSVLWKTAAQQIYCGTVNHFQPDIKRGSFFKNGLPPFDRKC